MLGIDYPILMGGMQWLAKSELVAAVSNAGAFGFITACSFSKPSELRDEIRKAKSLTDKPFGVNISMLPELGPGDITQKYVDIVCEEGVVAVETAGRNPEPYLPSLKAAGVKVLHKVPAVRFAEKAEKLGVDGVIIVGFECGGHPGMDDVTSLILTPKTSRLLKIPVVAAGGFGDGRGLMAALSLGAEAVLMGTRFMATQECIAHINWKERMLEANEKDTMVILRSIKNAARVIRNKTAEEVQDMENQGANLGELMMKIAGRVGMKVLFEGELDAGITACGQVVGMINDIPTVQELITRIVDEAEETKTRLDQLMSSCS